METTDTSTSTSVSFIHDLTVALTVYGKYTDDTIIHRYTIYNMYNASSLIFFTKNEGNHSIVPCCVTCVGCRITRADNLNLQ